MIRSLLLTSAIALSTPAMAQGLASYSYDPSAEVDVELLLAVDISQSMDTDEQEVQRAGYAAALVSKDFLDAIELGPIGRVAVSYMEWGGVDEHFVIADWTVIDGPDSALHFAEEIASAPLHKVQRTSIASALNKAEWMLDNNQYQGLRKVIDVSGDGPNNQGGPVTAVRDRIVARGDIAINGLPLMMKRPGNVAWPQTIQNLDHYYEDCVIGGPGSFAIPVRSQEGFADAIRMKLVMEIAGLSNIPTIQRAEARERVRCNLYD